MLFSEQSKVWVYQCNRTLTPEESEQIRAMLNTFCQEWVAHNKQLKAKAEIRYNQFIILMVDESINNASGCSIDKSVHFLKSVEEKFNVTLFDRMLFAYKEEGNIFIKNKEDFEELIQEGIITEETTVFNNLVNTKKELDTSWEISLKDSWHKSFFLNTL